LVTLYHCHDDNVIEAAVEALNNVRIIGSDVSEDWMIDQYINNELEESSELVVRDLMDHLPIIARYTSFALCVNLRVFSTTGHHIL
jgi:hypothetical protein